MDSGKKQRMIFILNRANLLQLVKTVSQPGSVSKSRLEPHIDSIVTLRVISDRQAHISVQRLFLIRGYNHASK